MNTDDGIKGKFLPVGTVVMLQNGKKRIMITGFVASSQQTGDKVFDYMGCLYPEGVISSERNLLFNHDQISKVYYTGYVDDEQNEFMARLNKLVADGFKVDDGQQNIVQSNVQNNEQQNIVQPVVENNEQQSVAQPVVQSNEQQSVAQPVVQSNEQQSVAQSVVQSNEQQSVAQPVVQSNEKQNIAQPVEQNNEQPVLSQPAQAEPASNITFDDNSANNQPAPQAPTAAPSYSNDAAANDIFNSIPSSTGN